MNTLEPTPAPGAAAPSHPEFRWDTVPPSERDWLRRRTGDIVGLAYRQACDTVRVGAWLEEAKSRLPHGAYEAWVESELPFSVPTACRYRQVARVFGAFASVQFEMFDESALYVLAQTRGVPPAAREHAVQLAESGQRVTRAVALEILDAHRPIADAEVREGMRKAKVDREASRRSRQCIGFKPDGVNACGRTFSALDGEWFCPACVRRRDRVAPEGGADPATDAKAWRAFLELAAGCDLVRVERVEDGDYEEGAAYSVTCHHPERGVCHAIRRDLANAVAVVAAKASGDDGGEEMRLCRAPGCGLKPVGMFGANRFNPGGLMLRCKECEKSRRAKLRERRRDERAARQFRCAAPPAAAPTPSAAA